MTLECGLGLIVCLGCMDLIRLGIGKQQQRNMVCDHNT